MFFTYIRDYEYIFIYFSKTFYKDKSPFKFLYKRSIKTNVLI